MTALLTFTGMDISEVAEAGGTVYRMDQTRDLRDFLTVKGLGGERPRENPIGDKSVLADGEVVCENLQSWCRSALQLHSNKNWVTSPSVKLIFMD